MAAKRCPNCRLVNPANAQRCDCGYSFADGSVGLPLDLQKPGVPDTSNSHTANAIMRLILGLSIAAAAIALRFILRR